MSDAMEETIVLSLGEATAEQLRTALSDAQRAARRCEERGEWHGWWRRRDAIAAELAQRQRDGQGGPLQAQSPESGA